jgi:hypothetical protein
MVNRNSHRSIAPPSYAVQRRWEYWICHTLTGGCFAPPPSRFSFPALRQNHPSKFLIRPICVIIRLVFTHELAETLVLRRIIGRSVSVIAFDFLLWRSLSPCYMPLGFVTLSHMSNSKLEQAIALMREAFNEEYQRGQKDATERVTAAVDALKMEIVRPLTQNDLDRLQERDHQRRSDAQRNRAPSGTPEALVRRVLSTFASRGYHSAIPPAEIKKRAESPDEKMVSYSAIRAALKKGEQEGWAKNVGRKWIYEEEKI